MKKWLRRLRGALGMALTWAVAWFGVGVLIGVTFFGGGLDLELLANGLLFATAGFIGGATLSGVLAIAGRRRTFDQMSLARFAGLGAVGGLVVSAVLIGGGSALTLTSALVAGVVTLMAAGSAAGSLALARRASARELVEAEESAGLLDREV